MGETEAQRGDLWVTLSLGGRSKIVSWIFCLQPCALLILINLEWILIAKRFQVPAVGLVDLWFLPSGYILGEKSLLPAPEHLPLGVSWEPGMNAELKTMSVISFSSF